MQQKPLTLEEIQSIFDDIQFLDREFRITSEESKDGKKRYFAQLIYYEADVDSANRKIEKQSARKWYISPFSTKTEVVETAYAMCLRSAKHIVREWFKYKGYRVMSPHFDIEARVQLCKEGKYDVRK